MRRKFSSLVTELPGVGRMCAVHDIKLFLIPETPASSVGTSDKRGDNCSLLGRRNLAIDLSATNMCACAVTMAAVHVTTDVSPTGSKRG